VSDALRQHFKGYVRPSELIGGQGVSQHRVKEDIARSKALTTSGAKLPKILVIDIETSPLLTQGFGLFNQNFSLDQIEEDWQILSFSSMWWEDEEVLYMDITEYSEKDLLWKLHELLDEADFVLGHNVRRFDLRKIKSRMILNDLPPFSPVRVLDTFEICRREFGMTSNKLEYLTSTLCKRYKKSGHEKFAGFLLWKEFLKGNPEAIKEMREYNILDVLSVRELFEIVYPWATNVPNLDLYDIDGMDGDEWVKDGYVYTNLSKFQRYRNVKTGKYKRGRTNLLSKEQRRKVLANII